MNIYPASALVGAAKSVEMCAPASRLADLDRTLRDINENIYRIEAIADRLFGMSPEGANSPTAVPNGMVAEVEDRAASALRRLVVVAARLETLA